MEWVEIPQQRVLRLEPGDMEAHFDRVADGVHTLYRRRRDQRVFRTAPFQPADNFLRSTLYLVEV